MTRFSSGNSEKIIENLDDLLKNKPGYDISNGVNILNSVKKIIKHVFDISSRTTVAFLYVIVRKDKKTLEKPLIKDV